MTEETEEREGRTFIQKQRILWGWGEKYKQTMSKCSRRRWGGGGGRGKDKEERTIHVQTVQKTLNVERHEYSVP